MTQFYNLEKRLPIPVIGKEDIKYLITLIKNSAGKNFDLTISTSLGDLMITDSDINSFFKNRALPNKLESITLSFIFKSGKIDNIYIVIGNKENYISIDGTEQCLVNGIFKGVLEFLKPKLRPLERIRPLFLLSGYFLMVISFFFFFFGFLQNKVSIILGISFTLFTAIFIFSSKQSKPIIYLNEKPKEWTKETIISLILVVITAISIIFEILKIIISKP